MSRIKNLPSVLRSVTRGVNALFGDDPTSSDWRVRLSIPNNEVFKSSYVLAPLRTAGGLVFPFTPSISITSGASYEDIGVTHQNYQFSAYQNSRANAITITSSFVSEDAVQAQYWIAVLHFLRSVTKMYTGDTEFAGSPPPILYLNGYGDYVFKKVPVVVKEFSMDLPKDVDYIPTTISELGSTLASVAGIAETVSGVLGSFGARTLGQVAGTIGSLANIATGGIGTNVTYVPVDSAISVTVQPVYSREATRNFSLKDFVSGKYMADKGGYI